MMCGQCQQEMNCGRARQTLRDARASLLNQKPRRQCLASVISRTLAVYRSYPNVSHMASISAQDGTDLLEKAHAHPTSPPVVATETIPVCSSG